MRNNTPDQIRKAFEAAKIMADRNKVGLLTVNCWNEWTETSYLLPDNIYGAGYLDAISDIFGRKTV